jgi:hypothetical protein
LFWWGWDEEDFRLMIVDFGLLIGKSWRADDAVGDERGSAAGFVGVAAAIADGVFSLRWEVVDDGGDEIGGFEDFEVALGRVVALGAVDDGLGGGVPGDFLEGERMAEEIFGEAFAALSVVGEGGFFAAVWGEESVGGEDVEVGVEDEVIAEGVDGGDGSEFALGEVEAGAALLRQGYEGHSTLP